MEEVRLLIVTITGEQPRFYEFNDSLDQLWLPPHTSKLPVHSSSPARNRNIGVRTALQNDFTHIFFVDDDHVFEPDTVMKLLNAQHPIISGLYCQKFPPFRMIGFDYVRDDGGAKFIDMSKIKYDEIISVQAVPGGCLLVQTEVFRRTNPPWFAMGQFEKDNWGDDLYFCKIAREAGYVIWLHTGVIPYHMTKVMIRPEFKDDKWSIEFKINSDVSTDIMPEVPPTK